MRKKTKKKIKKLLNVVLISIMSIGCWEIGKKQVNYTKSSKEYDIVKREKENAESINGYLKDKEYEWITVTETAIDYPLMVATDNEYYLTRNYKGETDIGGAIYYDSSDTPYNGRLTIIYGHSMRNGTMFNNLHYFQKDHKRFEESKLIISTKDNSITYKPLGFYVTNNDFFYKEIDHLPALEAVKIIEQNSDYFIKEVDIKEDSHIIALYTCDYSKKNGRLIVFYVSE